MRDGDPAALAGLCDRRGPAVLAYCRHVAGDAAAAAAAAGAFAQFRAAVVAADDPTSIDPETLLVSATRRAAAAHAGIVAAGVCADVPELLAARADHSISAADLGRLEDHLAACWTCRAPVARFKAAERSYRDPPDAPVPPEAAKVIVAALAAAAPVRDAVEGTRRAKPAGRTAAATNGNGSQATPAPAPANGGATAVLDVPTTEHRAVDEVDAERRAPSGNGNGHAGGDREQRRAARTSGREQRRPARRAAAEPRAAGGTQLPRAQRPPSPAVPADHGRGGLRRSIALPLVLVISALVVALFVAGVFGADDPASNPSSAAPADRQPAPAKAPEIVVVPGASDASAADVERAKARARAQQRAAAQPDRPAAKPDRAAATPDRPAAAKPDRPAATPPPPAVANVAPAPTKARKAPATANRGPKPTPAGRRDTGRTGSSTGAKRQINADKGATGAEQLPPKKDTSTVEELAPPPEPAPPPG